MFNFKTLLLTTIATLGLVANIQACPSPNLLLLSQRVGPVTKKQIESYRSQIDAIAQELTIVIDQSKNFDRINTKVALASNLAQNFLDARIAFGENRTSKDFCNDTKTIKIIDQLQGEIKDFAHFIDTIFPTNKTPLLHHFLQSIILKNLAYTTAEISHQLKWAAQNDRIMDLTISDLHCIKKLVSAIEQMTHKTIVFHKNHSADLKEILQAIVTVIKDDQFFQEIYKNFPLPQPSAWMRSDSLAAFIGAAEEALEISSLPSVKSLQNSIKLYDAKLGKELGADFKKIEDIYNEGVRIHREQAKTNGK